MLPEAGCAFYSRVSNLPWRVYVLNSLVALHLCLFFLTFTAFPYTCISGRACGSAFFMSLNCPLQVLLLFCSPNPLHWSIASPLIWDTISPAEDSLLKTSPLSLLVFLLTASPSNNVSTPRSRLYNTLPESVSKCVI